MQIRSNSPGETREIGRRLAEKLTQGTVIAFSGDLGAGKTAMISGLAEGLGVTDRVTSPTFTIVNEYGGGRLPLFHFDLYRLGGGEELYDIGWDDYLVRGGVCAVEWSGRSPAALPEGTVTVTISRRPEDGDWREITIEGAKER